MGALFQRAALVGVGMLGGSLGRAMLERGLVDEVIGIDQCHDVLAKALRLGAVSSTTVSLPEGVRGADLVILAAPVVAVLELLPKIAPLLAPGALVSDVCSTKAAVLEQARACLPESVTFLGGHPMAGSEKDGVEALDEQLFENAVYVLTHTVCNDASRQFVRLLEQLGAIPVEMGAEQHDRVVANISHLPHLAASVLAEVVAANYKDREEILKLAAGGFRDTTRVALGSPQLWRDICLTNRNELVLLLDDYLRELGAVRELVAAGDENGLLAHFQRARDFRNLLPPQNRTAKSKQNEPEECRE
ncbi:MAG: prephenate dehydrogenase/arogenate dehydrogenase family protein [Clostridium sp.]|nr:prephenate dehydrogenase/arogenate dehydrogenase family protein [Clostridium sp.]